ncbi:hypothetical protein [Paraliomyxa miuraensis]|uniref:hypothetical protein n=1 Tax=Paraliomyxa miuraensis TaxID=376150 RepID=UPI002258B671|nr:hypothetical protein [Paraliomyxa miuraensis]MCX4248057.1 hypothetical protein [Paraliomyxa miuraensis]
MGASSSAGSADTGRTNGPDDDGPITTMGGPSTGTPADSTSASASATGSEDTTGPDVDSMGECMNPGVIVEVAPMADAFIETGTGACAGMTNCQGLNFGKSPQGRIHDAKDADFRSYLLMKFDLGGMTLPGDPLDATLTIFVGHPDEVVLQVREVFPLDWTDGDGAGAPVMLGEATWLASAHPVEWAAMEGKPGPFDVILDGTVPLGTETVPMMGPGGSHPVTIELSSDLIADWNDEPGVIHLALTKIDGQEAIVSSVDGMEAFAPSLMISGCSS